MSGYNERNGLKPAGKRQVTHSSVLAPREPCPRCGSRHVLRTQSSNGRRAGDFWCGMCGAFFFAPS